MRNPKIIGHTRPVSRFKRRSTLVLVLALLCLAAAIGPFRSRAGISASRSETAISHSNKLEASDGLWKDVSKSTLSDHKISEDGLSSYRLLELNAAVLSELLAKAPLEFSERAKVETVVLSLPVPDGGLMRFVILESPIMSSELMAKFPAIKTYSGQGLDDKTAAMRLSWSPSGLQAYVLADQGSFMVSANYDDSRYYSSFFTRETRAIPFECSLSSDANFDETAQEISRPTGVLGTNSVNLSNAMLREYRLSFTVTQQFYQQFGGPFIAPQFDPGVVATIVAYVGNLNLVYEREMGIRFKFQSWIADRPNLCGNPFSNCFPPSQEPIQMLQANQFVLDTVFPGAANYDLGMALGFSLDPLPSGYASFGSGGTVAGVGGACENLFKGQSAVRLVGPAGNYLATMVTAHELAHLFGARHTFTSAQGVCGGALDPAGRVEPGSGSTIMSYTPVCGSDNLFTGSPASGANDYFHVHSLIRMHNHSLTFSSCGQSSATGNLPPIILEAGSNATIPAFTPFALEAHAVDPNGDNLTYAWEEFDSGTTLFRSYLPTLIPSRTFPSPFFILNTGNVPPQFLDGFLTGEVLPSSTRTLNFTVTVRDNRSGGGGTAARDTLLQINVIGTAGPFSVTQPNTPIALAGGSQINVSWNVANTTLAPIGVSQVRILLSTDGGNNFTILVNSTANDGTEVVTLPNIQTAGARIKVQALGNIFFDVSNTNFTINATTSTAKTIGLYNPAAGAFFLRNANSTGVADITFNYGPGGAGWLPLAGDWNGNAVVTTGLYNPASSTFFLRNTNSTGIADVTFGYGPGGAGWLPLAGDWNGDGLITVGLYNPATGTFFLRNSNSTGVADITFAYGPGGAGWLPIVGDWNGDGIETVGLYNPATGTFFLRNSNSTGVADVTFAYGPGGAGWLPLAGDWNGDGTDTAGLYNPANGTFFLRNSNSTGVADVTFAYGPGGAGWRPLVGDWNGL